MQTMLLVIGASVVYGAYRYVVNLRHNIAEAKRSGFNYIVVPCDPFWLPWQLTHRIWIPVVMLLPESWWEEWLDLMVPNMGYRTGFERFRRHGEAFLVVSPKSLLLHMANAEAIRYVAMRREQFPKWTASYAILRQFGENVVTSEGPLWRTHRKVTSASFNERNAALVFREAILQTQGMLRTWTAGRGDNNGHDGEPLRTVESDTMRLALNIIGYVGFGLRLLWPGQTLPPGSDPTLVKYASLDAPPGHKMSFVDTMSSLLENILLLLLAPKWLLRILPSARARESARAYDDYVKYMDEMMEDKMDEARQGDRAEEGMDLMGQLARTAYRDSTAGKTGGQTTTPVLTRDEIIGNAFVMFVAGHETTANTLHFGMVQLATNPSAQRRLQRDIDELLGDSDPATWDYEALVNAMTASMMGACMCETLRVMPPVTELPKKVSAAQDQALSMDGRRYVVPRGTTVSMTIVSVHQNPRYWPHKKSNVRPGCDDLADFRPERWFEKQEAAVAAAAVAGIRGGAGAGAGAGSAGTNGNATKNNGDTAITINGAATTTATPTTDTATTAAEAEAEAEAATEEDFGGPAGPDTNAQLFRPERGAYIPFSDGARSCLGRRIAQVEMMAALAVVFREHSLELAVDDQAGPDEVASMSRAERRRAYGRAQARSRWTMRQARSLITLKLHGGLHVPVRVVRRGEERFVSWMDDHVEGE